MKKISLLKDEFLCNDKMCPYTSFCANHISCPTKERQNRYSPILYSYNDEVYCENVCKRKWKDRGKGLTENLIYKMAFLPNQTAISIAWWATNEQKEKATL